MLNFPGGHEQLRSYPRLPSSIWHPAMHSENEDEQTKSCFLFQPHYSIPHCETAPLNTAPMLGPPPLWSVRRCCCAAAKFPSNRNNWETHLSVSAIRDNVSGFPSLWFADSADSPGWAAYRLSPEPIAPSVPYLPHLEACSWKTRVVFFYYKRWNDGHTDPNPTETLFVFTLLNISSFQREKKEGNDI